MTGLLLAVRGRAFEDVHWLLYAYNAIVIALLTAFLCLTQYKIHMSMGAYAFMKQVHALPFSPVSSIFLTVHAFLLLASAPPRAACASTSC